jgi:DNA polymerase III sliding clamp (beta) subunit (PCNA family)
VTGANVSERGISLGINGKYFLDMLTVVDGERFFMQFDDKLSPILILTETPGFTGLIMPITLMGKDS